MALALDTCTSLCRSTGFGQVVLRRIVSSVNEHKKVRADVPARSTQSIQAAALVRYNHPLYE